MKKLYIVRKNKVNIIPLIDIIFLMLVFFMLATNFNEHKELNFLSKNTKETINKANKDSILIIKIVKNEFKINNENILFGDIENKYLKKWKSQNFKKIVITNDKNSEFQNLISILDLIKNYDIKNVNFSNEP